MLQESTRKIKKKLPVAAEAATETVVAKAAVHGRGELMLPHLCWQVFYAPDTLTRTDFCTKNNNLKFNICSFSILHTFLLLQPTT